MVKKMFTNKNNKNKKEFVFVIVTCLTSIAECQRFGQGQYGLAA